ncbi:MAG: SAM-dependent methyltransferase [Proteobacteria bacterium]|nr:SAM-dependent methyltransferase [Pseudomonadota bacterium]
MNVAQRLALGQWYTPAQVADLALALALPRDVASARVLDPACGDGVFLARARAAGVSATNLCGIELDAAQARAARQNAPAATIVRGDLFARATETLGDNFDAVVGNPPYVRQERLNKRQKERIRQTLARDWPSAQAADLDRLVGRGDLATACVLRALHFARPGARVVLVVSSALLDAGYGSALWRTVATAGHVLAWIDAPGERWFADAAVNAVIVVLERHSSGRARKAGDARSSDGSVRIARLAVSTAEAARRLADPGRQRSALDALDRVAEVRSAPVDQPVRWRAYLRAPQVWFDFERTAGHALVPLSHIAEVRRGVTSGANDVFYMERTRAEKLSIEKDVLMPLLRSPRATETIAVDPATSAHVALICPPEAEKLARHNNARRYLQAHRHVAGRPTLRNRDPWWALRPRPARLFLTKAYANRFVQRLAHGPMVADQRVYAVYPAKNIDVRVLAAIVNSTFTTLALESLGRASMGEGALEWTVADAASLPVLDPRAFDSQCQRAIRAALADLAGRSIGPIAEERHRLDRRRLDRAVAEIQPGLADLLDHAWPALIDAVETRTTRRDRIMKPDSR